MAIELRIQCVSKRNRPEAHERIENVGGRFQPVAWRMSEIEALAKLHAGTHTFYTDIGGKRAEVRIGKHHSSHGSPREYLTTGPDGDPPDDLLMLPECLKLK